MKIGLLTQYYPPEMGAPQARLSELATRLLRGGHEVFVLTAMPSYPLGRVFDGYGGVYRREVIDDVSVVRTWAYASNSMAVTRRLANYGSFVASSAVVGTAVLPAVDYLITETPPIFLGLSGWALARSRRAQFVLNVSDLWVESAVRLGVLHDGAALRAARQLESFLLQRADLVTGQSRGIVEIIGQAHPSARTYHLSNGVDIDRFKPDLASDSARAELGPADSCIAIYAGLLGIAQGLDQLLRAATKLAHLPNIRIVIVGDGPDAVRLKALASELALGNVTWLGPRRRDEIPSLLASADIGLVPLGTELPGAVPSKLYEAMASGLPVVAVADGEPADIVRAAEAGVTVSPGDIDSLAAAIAELSSDRNRRQELGLRGRQAVSENFNRDTIAEQFIGFLESNLAASRRQRLANKPRR